MLVFKGRNRELKLDLLGYEFLSSNTPEDLDWIDIEIKAFDENYKWKCRGAYLRISELHSLFRWLVKVSEGLDVKKRINFLENELSFGLINPDELAIYFDFNFHPKGKKYDVGLDSEYELIFKLNDINFKDILKSLKIFITEYPIRYNNNYTIN